MDKELRRKHIETILLILSGILTVGILLLMDLWLIPQIERHTGGLRVFDLNAFGYSFDTAREFVRRLSASEKTLYLKAQLPLDFLCPVCYGCFFYLSLKRLCRRTALPIAAPAVVMALDYAENFCALRMLTVGVHKITATIGSICTCAKSVSMCLVVVLICIFFVQKKQKQY